MGQREWKSANGGRAYLDGMPRLVPAPPVDEGIGNALADAFSCASDLPDDFHRLLAQMR